MLFLTAVGHATKGGRIYREGWGKSEHAFIVNGDDIKVIINTLYGTPTGDGLDIDSFFMRKVDGKLEVYAPSLEDMLADDWKVAITPSSYK